MGDVSEDRAADESAASGANEQAPDETDVDAEAADLEHPPGDAPATAETARTGGAGDGDRDGERADAGDLDALRKEVEEKYDFENFSERDMAEMTAEEWDVAFDPDTWITGDELLSRVENELKSRIADREVFATLEYATIDGHRALVAYSDTDYAIIFPDGTVEGRGTVVRDVKPTIALCSMDSYEVEEPPEDWHLPEPDDLSGERSELGNWMLQLLAFSQLLIGIIAIGLWITQGLESQLVLGVVGMIFIGISLALFLVVANARLSDRFRTEEYEYRLRSIGSGTRPPFLPIPDEAFEDDRGLEGPSEEPQSLEEGG